MNKWAISLVTVSMILFNQAALAKDNWHDWVSNVREEALGQGISPNVFDRAFAQIPEPSRRVKGLSKHQPEHRLTYTKYRNTRASKYKIMIGQKRYKENQALLEQIGKQYGVDPCFITSFWGMETSYGSYMGNFPVIKSLATLAYDSNRKEFFRKQLFLALRILNDGHVSLEDYKGEWAGASGQPQFLPSSFVNYAVDYNGDGRKDIWKTKSDVFASIANYMIKHGWKTGQPWGIKVTLPAGFDDKLEGLDVKKPVSEWVRMGVRAKNGQALPLQDIEASIVKPYGGPVFLAYPNYRMIMRYNNSIYYASAIGYMADKICKRSN